jgi:hypothetical protein
MGSSGGGGSSGKVDYPDYLKELHKHFMCLAPLPTDAGDCTENLNQCMICAMNQAFTDNPFEDANAFDPGTEVSNMMNAVNDFATLVHAVDTDVNFQSYVELAYTQFPEIDGLCEMETEIDGLIEDDVDAFADQLDAQIVSDVTPRFEQGMRDAGAALSSAFVIGRSLIEEGRNIEVAKYSTGLRVEAFKQREELKTRFCIERNKIISMSHSQRQQQVLQAATEMSSLMAQTISFEQDLAKLIVESNRIAIVAQSEEVNQNLDLDEKEALWDLEVFEYSNHLIASIAGGTASVTDKKQNKFGSAIGGALSGAGAGLLYGSMEGSKVNPGWGTVIGGALGAAAGLLG